MLSMLEIQTLVAVLCVRRPKHETRMYITLMRQSENLIVNRVFLIIISQIQSIAMDDDGLFRAVRCTIMYTNKEASKHIIVVRRGVVIITFVVSKLTSKSQLLSSKW